MPSTRKIVLERLKNGPSTFKGLRNDVERLGGHGSVLRTLETLERQNKIHWEGPLWWLRTYHIGPRPDMRTDRQKWEAELERDWETRPDGAALRKRWCQEVIGEHT